MIGAAFKVNIDAIGNREYAYIGVLIATLKDDTTDNKRTLKRQTKCQRFAKLKEMFCQHTCRHKNTTFYFAQPHPSPHTTLTSGRLIKIEEVLKKINFTN